MIMENFEDPIFDDEDEFDEIPQKTEDDPNPDNQEPNDEADDLTTEVLRLKGIADPSKIKFEDETGAVIERSWDTLSRNE
jgi:hypothetical protein